MPKYGMRRRERKIRRVRIILFTTRGGTRSKSSRGQVRSPVFIFCLFYLARWDEWVPASRILKKNAEGEEKQRTVLEVQRRAKEEKEVKRDGEAPGGKRKRVLEKSGVLQCSTSEERPDKRSKHDGGENLNGAATINSDLRTSSRTTRRHASRVVTMGLGCASG